MNAHHPTETDFLVASHIEGIVGEFLRGNVDGLAMVAVRSDGSPCKLYLNKAQGPILTDILQELVYDYETNQQFRALITAPENNRSLGIH